MKRVPFLALAMILVGVLGLALGCVANSPSLGPQNFGGWMMRGWSWSVPSSTTPLTLDQAITRGKEYVAALGNDLELAEVMEFSNHFYGEVKEKASGRAAFEFLMDKFSGAISPEPGPNMMWNAKYGHMGGGMMMGGGRGRTSSPTNTITPAQARQLAQQYLDTWQRGATVGEDLSSFYGYYTLHVERDGQVIGMLSVNGWNGSVWYHTWHGTFIGMKELD